VERNTHLLEATRGIFGCAEQGPPLIDRILTSSEVIEIGVFARSVALIEQPRRGFTAAAPAISSPMGPAAAGRSRCRD
jgi:hypothetical protein